MDIETIKKEIRYDPGSGNLLWKNIHGNRKNPIGRDDGEGYLIFQFKGKALKCHRVAFALLHGFWPETVDHINRVKSDNRIDNIRACSRAENLLNRGCTKTNQTGIKGLHIKRQNKKWIYYQAIISLNKKKYMKTFPFNEHGKELAVSWLDEMREILHADFACK